MDLPEDIVRTIKDFSMPMTNPYWRSTHKMTDLSFHLAIARKLGNKCPKVIFKFIDDSPSDVYLYNVRYDSHGYFIDCIYNKHTWERISTYPFKK
jgi:hypothetical protein